MGTGRLQATIDNTSNRDNLKIGTNSVNSNFSYVIIKKRKCHNRNNNNKNNIFIIIIIIVIVIIIIIFGLGGLGITCSPRDPRFAGSNPAEVNAFFQGVKILNTNPPGGILSWGPESEISGSLKNLKPEKNRPLSKI